MESLITICGMRGWSAWERWTRSQISALSADRAFWLPYTILDAVADVARSFRRLISCRLGGLQAIWVTLRPEREPWRAVVSLYQTTTTKLPNQPEQLGLICVTPHLEICPHHIKCYKNKVSNARNVTAGQCHNIKPRATCPWCGQLIFLLRLASQEDDCNSVFGESKLREPYSYL